MPSLLEHARVELARADRTPEPAEATLARRQAAEKAWGYVVEQVSRVMALSATGPVAHRVRKDALAVLDRQAGTSLLRDYGYLEYRLHGDCFYEGACPPADLERYVAMAAEFPGRIQDALRQARRR